MARNFRQELTPNGDGPARAIFPVIPSDSINLDPPAAWLRCDGAGTLRYAGMNLVPVTITVVAGEVVDGYVLRVYDAGTSAAVKVNLVGHE